ncbi:unnamed protein product [Nippostrongylus brasiliensis]|uniref:Uncharacterized protein n=1 Tax=Nippostrongylus brasiliensis TaxID=27835 RepID=A0A158QZD8_NIPBR|nr:unnamed protein product [Nippostrongylus brasiliensis]
MIFRFKRIFQLWRALPAQCDRCSVNAQLSLRSYLTPDYYNIFFIQNMNKTLADTKCTVVSLENSKNAAAEDRLLQENDKCRLLVIDDEQERKPSELVQYEPLSAFNTQNEDSAVDVVGQIGDHIGGIIDLLVNVMYREPREREIADFVKTVTSLSKNERYVLMRADRDRQSLNMQLFFVNHRHQYCLDRYLRSYSYY